MADRVTDGRDRSLLVGVELRPICCEKWYLSLSALRIDWQVNARAMRDWAHQTVSTHSFENCGLRTATLTPALEPPVGGRGLVHHAWV